MLDRTANIKLAGDLLGHASPFTTARYLHPSLKGVAALVIDRNVNDRNMTRQAEVLAGLWHIPRHGQVVLRGRLKLSC
jgi:hypothetical protein